jgi:hypothetical protein
MSLDDAPRGDNISAAVADAGVAAVTGKTGRRNRVILMGSHGANTPLRCG